ncbi:uncharacterized protein LOC113234601, partial [Hyposmocoma kahamanoa]|uniref:uncharacterized protein LOC113234601 n=1 Tax=Hyposmocoma kahamanoa TaxID=1477025 RepID=UPI000E6D9E2A
MGALMSCMDGNSGVVEGATSVSLLLVELVSPDVMYNGLPWPDEDFTKQVSIERELRRRAARAVPGLGAAARHGRHAAAPPARLPGSTHAVGRDGSRTSCVNRTARHHDTGTTTAPSVEPHAGTSTTTHSWR